MKAMLNVFFVFICTFPATSVQTSSKKTMFGCENTTISLTCPTGSYVSIIRANYGRFSISVCNVQAITDIDTNCDTEDATTILLRKM